MQTTINTTNTFEGLYLTPNTKFSKTQKKIIQNIKNNLGSQINKKEFLIKPNKKNSVDLFRIIGLNKTNNIDSDTINYDKEHFIGNFDKKHPFKISHLRKAESKGYMHNLWKLALITLTALGLSSYLILTPKLPFDIKVDAPLFFPP